ncbi:leucine--tRNA ligase [Acinetobacter sp. ACIN00229]|uniref:leucine--tRNA ligase n=1 Tax=Acinetobacter sp. ACIN00229 TaxID=2792607 RepID=UPI0018E01E7B|nr:leucine--tRNA ligase [Acinetobacter sp. ACIN00229]MBI0421281.1 leucine--tRNA ligase [Acinetobacter sp. ACIN00229]
MRNFKSIEEKWQRIWSEEKVYHAHEPSNKKKFYCLDMFPYPSGSGLHVGHPRGYIASDVLSRFKRMQGYNVLHPMGFDAFGLPAEQYAIETGQHPAITTNNNINRFKEQLSKIGLSFDPNREFQTCDPEYYRWTQWIFIQLFNSWYDNKQKKTRAIVELISILEEKGNAGLDSAQTQDTEIISALQWKQFSDVEKSDFLMNYRLAYRAESTVNWCAALGTVLANDEVINGRSERGGHPVTKKKMKQWMLRITAFADRLENNLKNLNWPESLKDMQRNWIGKSSGTEILFSTSCDDLKIAIYTTHPETIYGVTFLVIAPEHPLAKILATDRRKYDVENYINSIESRSDRERISDKNNVTGVFTGNYALHPLTNEKLPIWIADYVLPEYGTGAIMGVPAADERDFSFSEQFNLPLIHIFAETESSKTLINSDILNGLNLVEAKGAICNILEEKGLSINKVKYRMRDAIFGRQRYWGEPIPIYYNEKGIPLPVNIEDLPIKLPNISDYRPTEDGQPPLARVETWSYKGYPLETTTMPGWAGSSWYFLRYTDPKNKNNFADSVNTSYWNSVDCYIGGAEHATGHLLYSRFWNQFLYDINYIDFEEPFKKVVCQGMILGQSAIIYREVNTNTIISSDMVKDDNLQPLHINIDFVDSDNSVDINKLKSWRNDYRNIKVITNDQGKLLCERVIEKMSKSKYNVVIPDDIIDQYGADCFRLHEMFLGPIEQSAPWSVQAIEGSSKFLNKVFRLFYNEKNQLIVSNEKPSEEVIKITHQTIKKVSELTESMNFNTAIANLMTCVNKFTKLNVHDHRSLSILLQLLHPYAPFLTEELWEKLGNNKFILDQDYPQFNEDFIHEEEVSYAVSINGKFRTQIILPADITQEEAEKTVLSNDVILKWLKDKELKKIIFVPNKIINLVLN